MCILHFNLVSVATGVYYLALCLFVIIILCNTYISMQVVSVDMHPPVDLENTSPLDLETDHPPLITKPILLCIWKPIVLLWITKPILLLSILKLILHLWIILVLKRPVILPLKASWPIILLLDWDLQKMSRLNLHQILLPRLCSLMISWLFIH